MDSFSQQGHVEIQNLHEYYDLHLEKMLEQQ